MGGRSLVLFTIILLTIGICGVTAAEQEEGRSTGLQFIAAGISVSLSCISAGYAVAKTGTAAIGAITERPELFGKCIAIVGLAEGIAIYGLLIAILII